MMIIFGGWLERGGKDMLFFVESELNGTFSKRKNLKQKRETVNAKVKKLNRRGHETSIVIEIALWEWQRRD